MRAEIRQLVIGGETACVLLETGRVVCWGDNQLGESGTGVRTITAVPSLVIDVEDAVALVPGIGANCAIGSGGSLTCWGANVWGRLGTLPSVTPPRELVPAGVTAAAIAPAHTCFVRDARVFCMGNNRTGALGVDGILDSTEPVEANLPADLRFLGVAAQGVQAGFTCAFTDVGSVYCFGGHQTPLGRPTVPGSNPPAEVPGLTGVVGLVALVDTMCALRSDHRVACWGRNGNGELGQSPEMLPISEAPVEVIVLLEGTSALAAGTSNVLALEVRDSALRVAGWGSNHAGQLAQTSTLEALPPSLIFQPPDSIEAAWIGSGSATSCIGYRLEGGTTGVVCSGSNAGGLLGVDVRSRSRFDVVRPFVRE